MTKKTAPKEPTEPVETLEPEVVEAPVEPTAEDEIAKLRDQLMRARADYDNLQKRVARDAALERERVKARVLEHFLTVYEYSRMAATEAEKTEGALSQGVLMVAREFERMLEMEGVTPIGAVGEAFDGSLHEAVGDEPVEGIEPGHVTRVVALGYKLGDRVLRYARVAVAPAAQA